MAGGPGWVRCGIGVNTDSKFLVGGIARIVMKADNAESYLAGELGGVAPQYNMSADELERFTFWHQPELRYYQTLNKKKITSSLLFGDGM